MPNDRTDRRCPLPAAALALALCSGNAAGFGGAGFIGECASFTSCTAAVASGASWNVRESLTERSPGYFLPYGLVEGVASHGDFHAVATSASVVAARLKPNSTIGPFFINAGAEARSQFGTLRADTRPGVGVSGVHSQGVDSARISIQTFAEASSAWRDVLGFSGAGHFSGRIALDGRAFEADVPNFPPFFDHTLSGSSGDWFFEFRVWDVTHLSVSDDFELGGPTLVRRVRALNPDETRGRFDTSLALDFDFEADTQYVVTADLRVTSRNGRILDLFHTVRLLDVQLSDGAVMTALSGHDYVQAVPEPSGTWLMALGLAVVASTLRYRRPTRGSNRSSRS
ncbi:MAG: hypothetical protein ACKVQR_24875 [Aquabacterium sp.]